MVKFVGKFLSAIGISMIVLGLILTSSMLIADDPIPIAKCKAVGCGIDCDGLQSQPGLCHGRLCATFPAADCGGCAVCGEMSWQGGYLCYCSR